MIGILTATSPLTTENRTIETFYGLRQDCELAACSRSIPCNPFRRFKTLAITLINRLNPPSARS
ncbi:MAG: hypothetical protein DWH78_04380 [Planctomycetota bacterium]|nr:MAG: hypothetical protein DWH78_04380 [Planctomycetota bacterium]